MNALVTRPIASRVAVRTAGQLRTKTSLIPPNVANLSELGKINSVHRIHHPEIFNKLKHMYAHLPKGPRPPPNPKTLWERYYYKYVVTESPYLILHILGVLIPTGYYISYFKGGHCEYLPCLCVRRLTHFRGRNEGDETEANIGGDDSVLRMIFCSECRPGHLEYVQWGRDLQ